MSVADNPVASSDLTPASGLDGPAELARLTRLSDDLGAFVTFLSSPAASALLAKHGLEAT
jgi:hypothetical protein